ncbi:uncharacterized protein DS421_2g51730 [Arachis hypogaea]|nr:uncharacterized protein DS421_2g51730 [Arachis hypogaea]
MLWFWFSLVWSVLCGGCGIWWLESIGGVWRLKISYLYFGVLFGLCMFVPTYLCFWVGLGFEDDGVIRSR